MNSQNPLYKALIEVKLIEEINKINKMEESKRDSYFMSLPEKFRNELISFSEATLKPKIKLAPEVEAPRVVAPRVEVPKDVMNFRQAEAESMKKLKDMQDAEALKKFKEMEFMQQPSAAKTPEPPVAKEPAGGDSMVRKKDPEPIQQTSAQTIPSDTGVGRAETPVASNIKKKEALSADELAAKREAGARDQDISRWSRNRVTVPMGDSRSRFRDAETESMKKLKDMQDAEVKTKADAEAHKKSILGRYGGPLALGAAATLLSRDSQDQQPASAAPAPAAPTPEKYKLVSGDTLSDKAKEWEVSVADIAKANPDIKNIHMLRVGTEIVKPSKTGNKIYQYNVGTASGPRSSKDIIALLDKKKVNESINEEEAKDLVKKMQDELANWAKTYGSGNSGLSAFDKLWSSTKYNPNPSLNSSFTYKPVNATRAELNRDGQNDSIQRTLDLKTADVGLKNANFRLGGKYDKAKIQDIQSVIGVKDGSGVFDQNTDKAVRDFQTKYGLKVDGIVGDQTMSMIDKIKQFNTDMTPAAGATASTPAPAAAAPAQAPAQVPNPTKKFKDIDMVNASYEPKGSLVEAVSKVLKSTHSNLFQEAAKAKKEKMADKDYDQDGEVESAKDEVWGSRMKAAKAAGKLKEEQIEDKSVVGAGTIMHKDPKTGKMVDYISPVTQNNPFMQASPDKKIPIPKPRPKDLDLEEGTLKPKTKVKAPPTIEKQLKDIGSDFVTLGKTAVTHPNTLKVGAGAALGAAATNTDEIGQTYDSAVGLAKDVAKTTSDAVDATKGAYDTVKGWGQDAANYLKGIGIEFGSNKKPNNPYKSQYYGEAKLFSAEELAYFEAVAPTPEDHAPNPTPKNKAEGGKGKGTLAEARPTEEMQLGDNQLHMNAKRAADNMANVTHKFKNGEKVKMTKAMGVSFLNRHSAAKKADEKDAILNYANQSPEAFAHVTKGGAIPSAEKEPKIKLGSMKGK